LVILQKRVVGLTEKALDRFLTRARHASGLRADVNVLVTSSAELQELNHRFRGKDQPTDVLSFPALPGLKPRYAGDIAISAEIAAVAAEEGFWSLDAPVRRVAGPSMPVPYAPELERAWLPDALTLAQEIRRACGQR